MVIKRALLTMIFENAKKEPSRPQKHNQIIPSNPKSAQIGPLSQQLSRPAATGWTIELPRGQPLVHHREGHFGEDLCPGAPAVNEGDIAAQPRQKLFQDSISRERITSGFRNAHHSGDGLRHSSTHSKSDQGQRSAFVHKSRWA